MSLRRCGAVSAGTTDRGDKEADEGGKSERILSVSAPLEVYRDAKDEEYSILREFGETEIIPATSYGLEVFLTGPGATYPPL